MPAPPITNSSFSDNNTAIWLNNNSNSLIKGCSIRSNQNQGIYVLQNSNPQILDNHIAQSNTGILVEGYVSWGYFYYGNNSPTIKNNIIRDNGNYGIWVGNRNNATISFNTIDNNLNGISFDLFEDRFTCTISSNIVTANNYGIARGSGGYAFSYNDVWGNNVNYSGLSAGATDLSVDPLYIDPFNEDFHLQAGGLLRLPLGRMVGPLGPLGLGGIQLLFLHLILLLSRLLGAYLAMRIGLGLLRSLLM